MASKDEERIARLRSWLASARLRLTAEDYAAFRQGLEGLRSAGPTTTGDEVDFYTHGLAQLLWRAEFPEGRQRHEEWLVAFEESVPTDLRRRWHECVRAAAPEPIPERLLERGESAASPGGEEKMREEEEVVEGEMATQVPAATTTPDAAAAVPATMPRATSPSPCVDAPPAVGAVTATSAVAASPTQVHPAAAAVSVVPQEIAEPMPAATVSLMEPALMRVEAGPTSGDAPEDSPSVESPPSSLGLDLGAAAPLWSPLRKKRSASDVAPGEDDALVERRPAPPCPPAPPEVPTTPCVAAGGCGGGSSLKDDALETRAPLQSPLAPPEAPIAPPSTAPGGAGEDSVLEAVTELAESVGSAFREVAPLRQPLCVICRQPPVRPKVAALCGHFACEACWAGWVVLRFECPVCRAKVRPNNLLRLRGWGDD